MDFSHIKLQVEEHPALKLLRARNAPLILSFLYGAFKKKHKTVVSHDDMVLSLASYMEDMDQDPGDRDILALSVYYVEEWCHEKNGYLRQYRNKEGSIVHELTASTERVFRWLEDLAPREFIGTESRFDDIYRRLKLLVEGSEIDPQKRIKELKKKRSEINREIKKIETTGTVDTLSKLQVRERFEEISRSARDLVADFAGVEQNFKNLIQDIYKIEAGGMETRGVVLAHTLDAHDGLRESPQGRTFHSFWAFLLADSGKDEINTLVNRVYEILDEQAVSGEDTFLKQLKYYLHQAGQKIISTNHILAQKLNRFLSDEVFFQTKRVRSVIQEIKQQVLELKGRVPNRNTFMRIDGLVEVNLPLERPLTIPRETTKFDTPPDMFQPDFDLFPLLNQFAIDKTRLRQNIRAILKQGPSVSLQTVLEHYPITQGLPELLGYFEIASSRRRSYINREHSFQADLLHNRNRYRVTVPEVIFSL